MNTGENDHAQRKILDMSRWISIAVLLLHFYFFCYQAFAELDLRTKLTDQLLINIRRTGLFDPFSRTKWIAL